MKTSRDVLSQVMFAAEDEGAGGADPAAEAGRVDDKKPAAGAEGGDPPADGGDKADAGGAKDAFPDNWRDLSATGKDGKVDPDLRKLLDRFATPSAMAKSLKDTLALRGKGAAATEMPDPKDEAAIKQWRKDNGIPDEPAGYKLPEDVTKRLSDVDKPMVQQFTEFAHTKGATPAAVSTAVEWYVNAAEQAEAARTEADSANGAKAEDALREAWPRAEYKSNITLSQRYLESIPGIGKELALARGPDGVRLVDKPEFIQWAADQGRQSFGDAVFATEASERAHNGRKTEIEKIMKTDIKSYWADTAMQKEYQDILAREEKRGEKK